MQTSRSVMVGVVMVGVLAVTTTAHMLGFGSCRNFNGMENFDPVRFNGTWYVIKKIATRSDCLTVTYNVMQDSQSFRVEEVRRPPFSDILPLDVVVTNVGALNPIDGAGKYSINWYNGIIPFSGTYTFGDTDYDNFAIDFECQEYFGFIRRVSATILSRTPQMDEATVERLTDDLVSKFEVSRNRLNSVDQSNCIEVEANDFNVVIDEQGFRSALQEYEAEAEMDPEAADDIVENFF